jgi:hypothetical protein
MANLEAAEFIRTFLLNIWLGIGLFLDAAEKNAAFLVPRK